MDRVRQLTAVIKREGDEYVTTCSELDIVSQGRTVEEARLNLVEAVEGFFEVASPSEVRRRWKTETREVTGATPLCEVSGPLNSVSVCSRDSGKLHH